GSAAENIEAGVDYMRARSNARVGSVHLNVLRPFPQAAVVQALAGKKNVIILERTDEPMATDNPVARDIRATLSKAVERDRCGNTDGPALAADDVPRIFSGSYGLGSRDFRPEHIFGAYEYATGAIARQDGKRAEDGTSYFTLGIDHPYQVISDDQPSLLPEEAIAVRFHSIGGWGAITTGKNLGAIIGGFNDYLAERSNKKDEFGRPEEVIHVSANPKYGSEKKGAPTSYFLVVAPERVRVNCDLRHVNVVLCCDPKAFTHTNPLEGLEQGGAFVWESEESPEMAWQRIPAERRQEIIDKKIRVFTLPGFEIAHNATDRADLQLRMQGNAFLGAFFGVSPFLENNGIERSHFEQVVEQQYRKKFGRLGEAVVASNMEVMTQGFTRVQEVPHGAVDAPDSSTLRGEALLPLDGCASCRSTPAPAAQKPRTPLTQIQTFDQEFRAGAGYNQPSTPFTSVGMMAAGTGDTASKYVARRETPVYIPENCTQCMECIAVCPDTALPNFAQDIGLILRTAVTNYITDAGERRKILEALPRIEEGARAAMREEAKAKSDKPFPEIIREQVESANGFGSAAKEELFTILDQVPVAYSKVKAIFAGPEKKNSGNGGVFSIFVSDLCKGCAACVTACGDHDALRMQPETEALNAKHTTGTAFLDLIPDTPQKFLGLYDDAHPQEARVATLRNHLMVRRNYDALVSGDGACAGCGEKSVLRSIVSLTEAYMRPLFHAKADRLRAAADQLEALGTNRLTELARRSPEEHERFRRCVAHLLMGLGGEDDEDTSGRMAERGEITDTKVIEALTMVLRQEAFNLKELQTVDGRLANGMSVMAMGAHTGFNTVYGSTPPNNPHPYPWMNSLFQDGVTISWIFGESFIMDHARRSVLPERLANALLHREGQVLTEEDLFDFTHFSDTLMT
ncbi:MAG: 2-oxoacid:acceptor oxidoreductase family protein, partial [Dehalococcoidia bacterium]